MVRYGIVGARAVSVATAGGSAERDAGLMDIRHMRQVMEICRAGSFARAAQALGLSQPTLSRSISRLEDELGVSLFDRSGGGARPTPFAEHISQRANELLSGAAALASEIQSLAAGEGGRVRLGLGGAFRDGFGPALLHAALRRYPRLKFSITVDLSPRLIDLLAARRLDIIVVNTERFRARPDLVEAALVEEAPFSFVVRPSHPALDRRDLTLLDLLDYPIAGPGLTPSIERDLPENLTLAQQDNLRAFACADYGLLNVIAQSSDAVVIGPSFAFERELASGALRAVSVRCGARLQGAVLTTVEAIKNPVIIELVAIARRALAAPPIAATP